MKVDQMGSIESRTEITQQGDAYRTSFDTGTDSVSIAVISTVAAITNTPEEELPPLYTIVDPDALETLVQSGAVIDISFIYHGHAVTVHGDGDIEVSKHTE